MTAYTVTASNSAGNGISLQVEVITGVTETGGATAEAWTSSVAGAGQVSITPNGTGSLILWTIENPLNTTTFTALTNNNFTTITTGTTHGDNTADATNGVAYAQGYYTGSVTATVAVTVGTSAPSGFYELSALELLGSGWAEDASTPVQANGTGNSITSASFTPPAGAVLVALVAANLSGTGDGTSLSVSSSPALTWTSRIISPPSGQTTGDGCSAIFTATVPAATVPAEYPQQKRRISTRRKTRWARRQQTFPVATSAVTPITEADVAAEVDDSTGLAVSAAIPLADVGAEADSIAVSVTLPLADTGAEVDDAGGISVSAAVPLADPGAEIDSIGGITAAVPLADPGAETDSITASVTLALGDAGAEVDDSTGIAVSAALALTDAGAETDAWIAGIAITLTDAGAETDAVVSAEAPQLPDVAAEIDSLVVSAQIAVADTAGEVDAVAVSASVPLADAAGATDSPQIAATVPLADAGAETDAITIMATIAVADLGATIDSVVASASVPLGDAGGAPDSVQISASLQLQDVVAEADSFVGTNASFTFRLPDAAGATESWYVVIQGAPDLSEWVAQPYWPRWTAEAASERWSAVAQRPRWRAESAYPRWRAEPAVPRWKATLINFDAISALSPENINVNWDSHFAGLEYDPTGQTTGQPQLAVTMALPVSSGNILAPAQPVTFYTASWYTGTTVKGWIAYLTVGPGGAVTLSSGTTYDVWSQLHGTPDSPVKFVGQLRVY